MRDRDAWMANSVIKLFREQDVMLRCVHHNRCDHVVLLTECVTNAALIAECAIKDGLVVERLVKTY